jgi:hypothetical protein
MKWMNDHYVNMPNAMWNATFKHDQQRALLHCTIERHLTCQKEADPRYRSLRASRSVAWAKSDVRRARTYNLWRVSARTENQRATIAPGHLYQMDDEYRQNLDINNLWSMTS